MPLIVGLHYALAFGLELALLAGFGLFGYSAGQGGWTGGVLAVLLVAAAILAWAYFAAPNAATRLPAWPLTVFKLAIFTAGTGAFWAAGWPRTALAFGLLAAFDIVLAILLGRI